ncbi:tetratricopeptide repeat protein [Plantactinospora solaniradicis]|uniref:Tetratricopeptide repeat protein n=1 Tax=Plantactinospora solaniradicis TaxID=1723736 RepID=A0ABW1KRI2_9ACTN
MSYSPRLASRRRIGPMAELPVQRTDEPPGISFGAELRRRRQEQKMSLAELAREVHYSRGFLSKIETGKAQPNRALAETCDELLGAGGDLVRRLPPTKRRPRWSPTTRPVDLPAVSTIFLGRADELSLVTDALSKRPRSSRIVVVYGLPGVGKTELVLHTAGHLLDRYPDGCLYLDLQGGGDAPVDSHAAIDHLLRRLGVPPELVPNPPAQRAAMYRQVVRDRNLLLVIDNPTAAADVAALVAPGGTGDILVASRRRLDALDEARQIELAPLSDADARALFEQIADDRLATDPGADSGTIDQITAACDRLPLAVRIAAARFRASEHTPIAELSALLEDERHRLSALDDGERSIADTFAAACAALPPPQALLFALLSVHPGPSFGRMTAGLLADAGEQEAARLLDRLVSTCLIQRVGPDRHILHLLVSTIAARQATTTVAPQHRLAAVDRLLDGYLLAAQHADLAATPQRHRAPPVVPSTAAWYATFTAAEQASTWFDAEQDNLVAICDLALAHDRPHVCWRLAYAMRDHFFRTRSDRDWVRTHRAALTAARRADDPWAVAVTLNNLGLGYAVAAQSTQADECYTEALQLFRDLGDPHGEANSLGHLAWTAHTTGQHRTAITRGKAALRLYEQFGTPRQAAITRRTIGVAEAAQGDVAAAEAHLRAAVAVFAADRLALDEAMTLNCLGDVAWADHRVQKTIDLYRRALFRARTGESTFEQARALRGLALASDSIGKHRAARLLTEQAQFISGLTR